VQMANFRSKFSAKYRFSLQNVANNKEECPRLKNKKQIQKKTPFCICIHMYNYIHIRLRELLWLWRHDPRRPARTVAWLEPPQARPKNLADFMGIKWDIPIESARSSCVYRFSGPEFCRIFNISICVVVVVAVLVVQLTEAKYFPD
jgi:hypothetical protein